MADDKYADKGQTAEIEERIENPEHHTVVEKDDIQGDIDVGAQALQGQELNFTEQENKRILRKIDWRIVPLAAWACGLQFVDKSGLGAAATYGLTDDLGLVGQEYSWCVSIFYFGYLAGAFFSGRALQWFHAGKVIGIAFFLWGCTLLGCVGVHNFSTLMALRFLLGIFESALVPGLMLITTMWYTPQEQPFRFGLWTMTNGAMPVPFLVIYYGLGHVDHGPVRSWRLIFLLIGLLSIVTGVVLYFFMPDNPVTVKWLNEREKAIAVKRVADYQLGIKNSHFKWEQLREALTDYRFWMMTLQMLTSQAAGNVTTNFLGIIIKASLLSWGFGYTALRAQLYTAPNYATQAVTQMVVSIPPTFFRPFRNYKQPLTAAASIVAVAGIAVLYVTPAEPQYQGRRLGACIIISCSGVNYTVVMSVIGSNVAGFTKKQVTTSMAFFMYCIVNIVTPQTFLGREAPRYHTGLGFVLGMLSAFITLTMATWLVFRVENARRDKLALTDPDYTTGQDNEDLLSGLRDETDRQNNHFRYSG
ncbi:MFS general substrate transporter [Rhizodiscina lignyota]|uniref:MFS general substrate transporter n=1 Tax=Rhizodiscina lignyota TaxID=1504668 RepID=A0A9P4M2T3_9PEZI|nr:MFS general substrate transporter [Rhizodiscina lignyota]